MIRLYALTIVILFVITPARRFEAAAQDKRWLSYEPAVIQLEGQLTMELKYGPPNYGEQPKTDAKVRVPVLMLIRSVNVRASRAKVLTRIL